MSSLSLAWSQPEPFVDPRDIQAQCRVSAAFYKRATMHLVNQSDADFAAFMANNPEFFAKGRVYK